MNETARSVILIFILSFTSVMAAWKGEGNWWMIPFGLAAIYCFLLAFRGKA